MTVEQLWTVRAKRSVVKCVLHAEPTWVELLLLQDDDITIRETFQDDGIARAKAAALRERLMALGWRQAS